MIERFISITNFRSIGTSSADTLRLDLNAVKSKDDKFGGLISLIGQNNSGKSNVLDALLAFSKGKFEESDTPYHKTGEIQKPVISLSIINNENGDGFKVKFKEGEFGFYKNEGAVETKLNLENTFPLINEFTKWLLLGGGRQSTETIFNNLGYRRENLRNQMNELVRILTHIQNRPLKDIDYNQWNEIQIYLNNLEQEVAISNQFSNFNDLMGEINLLKNQPQFKQDYRAEINNQVLPIFGIKLFPQIIKYDDRVRIEASQMIMNFNGTSFQNSDFFTKLYDLIPGENFNDLINIYREFHKSGFQKKFLLTNYEKQINKRIVEISTLFNQVYSFSGPQKYGFLMKLESDKVFFIISEDEFDIPLYSQSTGFKWFFDFFFNLLGSRKLENGDIVIIDEPATNLHMKGQVELRKLIQNFGKSKGILFIISTHSPFLIDQDYLDEIRLVEKKNQQTNIVNKFNGSEENSIDVLLPIKAALTVNRHVLINQEDTLIFVEGITDYNYLIAFKNHFKMDQLNFMPIQGIRRDHLDKELLKITPKPILLVDSDKEGQNVKDKYDKNHSMEIHYLGEVDPKFKEIEDLFSEEEQKIHCFNHENKKDYRLSSYFKHNFEQILPTLSPKTKDNFKKLLDTLTI